MVRPAGLIAILIVLFREPRGEWLEIFHNGTRVKVSLTGDNFHGFGPGFANAHF